MGSQLQLLLLAAAVVHSTGFLTLLFFSLFSFNSQVNSQVDVDLAQYIDVKLTLHCLTKLSSAIRGSIVNLVQG